MKVVMRMANLLGKRVVIVGDDFEQGLPIGTYGYVVGRIRDADSAYDYVVRVPRTNREYFVTDSDIETEQAHVQKIVAQVEHDTRMDYALKTHNRELFDELTGKSSSDPDAPAQPGNDEFVRKIRLNAYI